MLAPRLLALLAAAALAAVTAAASDDPDEDTAFHTLGSVDEGHTDSLDAVDDGRTDSLDRADDGHTDPLGTADHGHTDSLDSADDGHTDPLGAVDKGHTEQLDAVEPRAWTPPAGAPAPLPPLPPIEDGNWQAQAERAHARVGQAEAILEYADKVYDTMIRNAYPGGEKRQEIVDARAAARRDLDAAKRYETEIAQRAQRAGHPVD